MKNFWTLPEFVAFKNTLHGSEFELRKQTVQPALSLLQVSVKGESQGKGKCDSGTFGIDLAGMQIEDEGMTFLVYFR